MASRKPNSGKRHRNPAEPLSAVILADIALRGGGALLRRAVEQGILQRKVGERKAKKIVAGRGMGETLLATAAARIASRSVPGAIVIGGGLIAKTLYDRRRARKGSAEAD